MSVCVCVRERDLRSIEEELLLGDRRPHRPVLFDQLLAGVDVEGDIGEEDQEDCERQEVHHVLRFARPVHTGSVQREKKMGSIMSKRGPLMSRRGPSMSRMGPIMNKEWGQ